MEVLTAAGMKWITKKENYLRAGAGPNKVIAKRF